MCAWRFVGRSYSQHLPQGPRPAVDDQSLDSKMLSSALHSQMAGGCYTADSQSSMALGTLLHREV